MKFLAILRDSLREALDSKVLYVMIALALLLTGAAFALSFVPRPIDEKGIFDVSMADLVVATLNMNPDKEISTDRLDRSGFMRFGGDRSSITAYEGVTVAPINGSMNQPNGNFVFTIRKRYPEKKDADEVREKPEKTLEEIRSKFGTLDQMKLMEATDVSVAQSGSNGVPVSLAPNEIYFLVKTKPTSATVRSWPHDIKWFGALTIIERSPLGMSLFGLLNGIVNGVGAWVTMLVSVVITAFFIPNMLRKGTIDLLLVKPLHRSTLLFYKYLGGLLFILINTTVAVLGVWLAIGLRSGLWPSTFLLSIFVVTFFFAILYSVSTLFAVLTRSTIVAIMITVFVWFGLFIVGVAYQAMVELPKYEESNHVAAQERWSNGTLDKCIRAVHFVTPRPKDLDLLLYRTLRADLVSANQLDSAKFGPTEVNWTESLSVSFAFIAVILGFSMWWFATRDY